VFDTLLMAAGLPATYLPHPPADGPWLLYAATRDPSLSLERCITVAHCPDSWLGPADGPEPPVVARVEGLPVAFAHTREGFDIGFDLVANAFHFLSSGAERRSPRSRVLYADSVFDRLDIPQDVVDRYLHRLVERLDALYRSQCAGSIEGIRWPGGKEYAVALSHDVDFIPEGLVDNLRQGAKTIARHLVHHKDPVDALRSATGLASALVGGRDPYGCIPEIIRLEKQKGVTSSFQVAVGHRHPNDVNYRIEDDRIRDYLRVIQESQFDLCLHGSYRSTENADWYLGEVALLTQRLGRPLGSRQHFLSFDYDVLFAAQERAGIQYDMSMGYPDRTGPRAGFSYPYFPYCCKEDRPYDVLQISLFIMDVTLRGYLQLRPPAASKLVDAELGSLRRKRGCASVVWHPIVFGGARDPGYDGVYWKLIDRVQADGGLATDGRTINQFWRGRSSAYSSFQGT
jgi:hypothetical protein